MLPLLLLLLLDQLELLVESMRPERLPPIQPLLFPAVVDEFVVLLIVLLLLLLIPKPGGGPRADFIGKGAPHNSEEFELC